MGVMMISTTTPVYQATPNNPTGTTNTTGVMMGLSATITPQFTGRVVVTVCGTLTNSTGTAGNGAKAQIRYGTGAAPANGAALTGTAVGSTQSAILERATANDPYPFSLLTLVTGLSIGTPVWIDISLAAIAAGTGVASGLNVMAFEI